MRQLFSVGEEVILDAPKSKGDAIVLEARDASQESARECALCKNTRIGYKLTIQTNPLNAYWCQCVLRKKPKPAEDGFEELYNSWMPSKPTYIEEGDFYTYDEL